METSQSLPDQRLADALPLTKRPHRYRSKPIPVAHLSVDRDRRKSDVANDCSALGRNEGKGQRACDPQRIDDLRFCIIAERHALERGAGKGVDCGRVVGTLKSNLHVDEPVGNLIVQPTELPRSLRPWWLLRRVSLDRDVQRIPAFSGMALKYLSWQQTQGFRASALGQSLPPRRFTSGRRRRYPRKNLWRTARRNRLLVDAGPYGLSGLIWPKGAGLWRAPERSAATASPDVSSPALRAFLARQETLGFGRPSLSLRV